MLQLLVLRASCVLHTVVGVGRLSHAIKLVSIGVSGEWFGKYFSHAVVELSKDIELNVMIVFTS